MGDRTYCHLYLHGPVSDEALKAIEAEIGKHKPDYSCKDEWCWGFDEVNYANMPDDLRRTLLDAKVLWSWSWESGGEYSAGVEVCDGETSEEFITNGGDIVIRLHDIDNGDIVAQARHFDAVRKQPFVKQPEQTAEE